MGRGFARQQPPPGEGEGLEAGAGWRLSERRPGWVAGLLGCLPLLAVVGFVLHHLSQEPTGESLLSLKEREGMVRGLEFSPDGRTLLACYLGGPLSEWEVRSGMSGRSPLLRIDPVFSARYLPDGRRALLKTHRGLIAVHDRESGELLSQLPKIVGTNLAPVAVSGDGRRAAIVEMNRLSLIDLATSAVVGEHSTTRRSIRCVAFSPDSRTVAIGDEAGRVTICSAEDASAVRSWEAHPNFVQALGFAPDGSTLYTGSYDRSLRSWRVSDGAPIQSWDDLPSPVSSLAASGDGRWLAVACGERSARLYDLASGGQSRSLPAEHAEMVLVVTFAPDGRTLATGASDGSVRVWSLPDPGPVPSPPPRRDRPRGSRE